MVTLRKAVAIVLGIGMISAVLPAVVMAGDKDLGEVSSAGEAEVTEDIIYDDRYEITIKNGNIVEVFYDGKVLFTAEYDDAGNRIMKNGTVNSTFTYEEGYLIAENRDGRNIEYFYEEKSNGAKECIAFLTDDEKYYLNRDEYGKITGISDSDNNEIARYCYAGIHIEDVLRYTEGSWVKDETDDFIGNYNKIRLYGDYQDEETGWYYSAGLYTDALRGVVIGLNDDAVDAYNPFYNKDGISLLSTYYEDIDFAADEWATALMDNSNFVVQKTPDDVSSMSLVERIARTIYGENTSYTTDQDAIAWVMLNRHHQWSQTLEQVVVPGQFSALCKREDGKLGEAFGAINNSLAWKNAVYLACLMLTDSSEDAWNHIVPRPYGISTQLYFVSAHSKIEGKKITDVSGGVRFVDDKGNVSFICDISMAGMGTYSSAAELEQAYINAGRPWVNVFFNKK